MRILMVCASVLIVFMPMAAAEERQVDWTGPSGSRVRQVRTRPAPKAARTLPQKQLQAAPVPSNVIDSPPIDGFVPWIVISTTNKREEDGVFDAVPEYYSGTPTPSNPLTNYAIGIFDTGASAHVFGYGSATTLGLAKTTYLTKNQTTISGVTGSVDAWVSQPIGVFMGGLGIPDPNGTSHVIDPPLKNRSGMVGESNVSVIVGDNPGTYPDLATAIGSPMSVFYAAHIRNDRSITVEKNGKVYTGPPITFHDDPQDPAIPSYPIRIPLELRPMGAYGVQYIAYDLEGIFDALFGGGGIDNLFNPTSPSVIIGNSTQSLFFGHSVDLTEGAYSAIDKTRFMLDTGAQISVIGSRIAARLGINPAAWEFQVDIEGVTGEVIQAPGFYIDSLRIPAMGEWLEFTNVPMVLLDIYSPEGGTLDGIIGMNLFVEYNMVLRGGGLFLTDDPVLEVGRIADLSADLAPGSGDGRVDLRDFEVFGKAWQTTNVSAG